MRASLIILATLGICGALYLGSAVFIPVALAVFGAALLTPLVERLSRWGLSRIAAAGCVMLLLAGTLGTLINFTIEPASNWIERAPSLMRDIELKLRPLQRAAGRLDQVAQRAGQLAGQASAATVASPSAAPVASTGLVSRAVSVLVPTVGAFFMIFFLLAFGQPILHRLAEGCEKDASGRRLIANVERTRREMGRYLGTLAIINVFLGFATAGICLIFDLPNPALWGVMAAVFNFVPYAGSATTLVILTVVALLTHGLGAAAGVAGCYLALDTIEGQLVQPLAVGKRLSLNPLAIFLALWLGAALWGLAGLLLATPILLTVRIICRRNRKMHVLNDFLAPVRERPLISKARAWRRRRRRQVRAMRSTKKLTAKA